MRVGAMALCLSGVVVAEALSPEAVLAGVDGRVEAMFRAEAGKQLKRAKKRPPLSKGRGAYVRAYSYSMVAFAARCFHLNEMLEEANAALVENAEYYLENEKTILDRDSFHWHAEIVMRLIEMYGSNGTAAAGRLTKETEAVVLKPIWVYASKLSSLEKAEHKKSQTWHIYSSENHHVMDFTVHWHFAKLAKDRPAYRERKFEDGATAAAHYRAWNEYFVVYCLERARKGLFVEMMNGGYNTALLKGIYNFHDFGEPEVRRAAAMLMDLYFAYWAQEQIGGVQGGGRARVYFGKGLDGTLKNGMTALAWMYFGIGEQQELGGHSIAALTSSYRPPPVVADIALDVEGRGRYEVRQRPQGLGRQGSSSANLTRHEAPNKLRTDGGGILRYSYCDPAFIMGTPMTEARPLTDWVHISAQNRWQGVIFAGEGDGRIVPVVRPKDSWRALNAQWSVQSKGSLITQKLKTHKGAAEMIVWFAQEGLSEPVEKDGVVFVESKGAYAAVRVVKSKFEWRIGTHTSKAVTGDRKTRPGRTLVPKDPFAPVIVEVMAKSDVKSFAVFQQKVLGLKPKLDGPLLHYRTVYGDVLAMDTGFREVPTINGAPVAYNGDKAFESPFLDGDYNSGVVTIRKGERKKVLDFNRN